MSAMGFLENLFHREGKKESILLIDVGTDSVAGAYVAYEEGKLPAVLYTRRIATEPRENEQPERAMLRALDTLEDLLIREGAPALARYTGSGTAHGIAVALDAPWQKSVIRTDRFEKVEPFLFTRELAAQATKDNGNRVPGKLIVEEHMIGALLNGYKTQDPYGKRANRVSIIVLASLLEERVAKHVTQSLREAFHTEQFRMFPGSGLRFESMHAAFPHQEEALIIDATAPNPSIGLIRKGLPTAIEEVSAASARHGWTGPLSSVLTDFAKKFPLPRTVFFLSLTPEQSPVRAALTAPPLRKLWMSDGPPKLVSVTPSHLSSFVRPVGDVGLDLKLFLMALYHQAGE